MKMSIKLLLLILASFSIVGYAEVNESISYYPVVTGNDIPETVRQSLLAKMDKAIADNGYGSEARPDRFVLLAKCNILDKEVVPTTPPRITQTVGITFIIGDVIENKTFASASFEYKGIGIIEIKAWQTAISRLKPDNVSIHEMFQTANEKIDAYYASGCRKIIEEAQAMAEMGEYEKAISSLMSVPSVCTECSRKAQTEAVAIYDKMQEIRAGDLLAKAKNAWAVSQDMDGARNAMSYINSIPVDTESYAAAEELVKTITEKLSSDKEREWQQRVKEYNDNLQMRKTQSGHRHKERMASIAAARSVAEKWAENQPQTNVYLNW